jgi:1,4-dihydroxy-2-naphthoate octaprenyltransferase
MWFQALRTMPQVDKLQWSQLDAVSRWLIASRASVLLMTFTSCAIGGLLAWRDGLFNHYYFGLTLAGLLLAHATNNQLNDLTDTVRGIDSDNYYRNRYGTHVLEQGLMSRGQLLRYILFTGAMALLAGALLVWERGGITIGLLAAGAFFVLFYTYPLKTIGLGEPAVLLVWGPLMVGGTYFVVAGQWSWPVALISLVYALGPTSVLFGKHIDKLEADRGKGVHSLPVLLGELRARQLVIAMLVLQYALTLTIVLAQYCSFTLLLVLLNLPVFMQLWRNYRLPRPEQQPPDFPQEVWPLWYAAYAFDHTRRFSGLFLLGLLLDLGLASIVGA